MSFTCPIASDLTPQQLAEEFAAEARLLPTSILPTDREDIGLLKSSVLADWMGRLSSAGILPTLAGQAPSAYTAKVSTLLDSAKKEYCFYESRYRASLNYLFTAIRNAASNPSAEAKQVVQVRLQTTQALNRKVNDLVQILNAITDKMMKSSTTLQSEIETFNRRLREQRDKLEQQNAIIHSNEAAMKLQKEMVNYSEQKARYSDNLLKMYSFLNIVALGLLVYVYKAAAD